MHLHCLDIVTLVNAFHVLGAQTVGSFFVRLKLAMALFWIFVLGVMYVAMDRYLAQFASDVLADGRLLLKHHRHGHFYADGRINGQTVRFMVDTGASAIAVTDALALRAGLHGGEQVQFQTANGIRLGRLVRAETITVGPLQVRNLSVGTGYASSNEQDALLGQNFLRHFDVLMRNDYLELRPRAMK